jgi:putative ABC transport system ATP-binding protein
MNNKFETTLVLVTHDKDLASRCDRIIEIDSGKLVG